MRELKTILSENKFRFDKSLGQNFITDVNLLRAIVGDSKIDKNSCVIEIGAGGGTLTREIALCAKKVYAYEIDLNLKPILAETLRGLDNVELRFYDILKQNLAEVENEINEEYHVIANLPYYITTPLIIYFIENSQKLKSMTVMVQKEVAQRLCAKAGSKNYGSVTVAVDFCGGAHLTRNVSREVFFPVPNVDSAIVKIYINRGCVPVKNKDLFYRLYRSAFAMRRKTLLNNIISAFNTDKVTVAKLLTDNGFNADIRGERLSAKDFAKLADAMSILSIK